MHLPRRILPQAASCIVLQRMTQLIRWLTEYSEANETQRGMILSGSFKIQCCICPLSAAFLGTKELIVAVDHGSVYYHIMFIPVHLLGTL